MPFENLQLEPETPLSEQELQNEAQQLADVQNYLARISESRNPDIQKKLENTNLNQEILQFLEQAGNNALAAHLSEFNADKFDKDNEKGLDKFEFEQFQQALQGAIEEIIVLDGLGVFSDIHEESAKKGGWTSPDKWLAQKADLQELILGDETGDTFTEEGLKKLGITEEDLQEISEKKFDMTNPENWKEMGILLSKELGEGVEMILRFLGNIPAGVILSPRYLKYRVDINSSDSQEQIAGEIKIKELVEDNPSLAILDILGEKGVAMIKALGEMMVSGKQGDIAMMLVTIAGLLAGGAGAVKFGAKMGKMNKLERIAKKVQRGAERVDDIVGGAGIGHMTGAFKLAPEGINVLTKNIAEQGLEIGSMKKDITNLERQLKKDPDSPNINQIKEEIAVKKQALDTAITEHKNSMLSLQETRTDAPITKEELNQIDNSSALTESLGRNLTREDIQQLEITKHATGLKELNTKQQAAVLKAHYEVGGTLHDTNTKQGVRKLRILMKEGGFNGEQAMKITDSGAAGSMDQALKPEIELQQPRGKDYKTPEPEGKLEKLPSETPKKEELSFLEEYYESPNKKSKESLEIDIEMPENVKLAFEGSRKDFKIKKDDISLEEIPKAIEELKDGIEFIKNRRDRMLSSPDKMSTLLGKQKIISPKIVKVIKDLEKKDLENAYDNILKQAEIQKTELKELLKTSSTKKVKKDVLELKTSLIDDQDPAKLLATGKEEFVSLKIKLMTEEIPKLDINQKFNTGTLEILGMDSKMTDKYTQLIKDNPDALKAINEEILDSLNKRLANFEKTLEKHKNLLTEAPPLASPEKVFQGFETSISTIKEFANNKIDSSRLSVEMVEAIVPRLKELIAWKEKGYGVDIASGIGTKEGLELFGITPEQFKAWRENPALGESFEDFCLDIGDVVDEQIETLEKAANMLDLRD